VTCKQFMAEMTSRVRHELTLVRLDASRRSSNGSPRSEMLSFTLTVLRRGSLPSRTMTKRTRTRSPSPTTGDVKNFFTPKRARAFATTGHTRAPSPEAGGADGLTENKPGTSEAQVVHRKIASPEAAAVVDAHPPFFQLRDAAKLVPIPQEPGQAVVYWQRMQDMRACDNRALAQASQHAQQLNLPLVVLFVISPDEYAAHDRSARRIDFALRNLAELRVRSPCIDKPTR
jgi:hypothetical protein